MPSIPERSKSAFSAEQNRGFCQHTKPFFSPRHFVMNGNPAKHTTANQFPISENMNRLYATYLARLTHPEPPVSVGIAKEIIALFP